MHAAKSASSHLAPSETHTNTHTQSPFHSYRYLQTRTHTHNNLSGTDNPKSCSQRDDIMTGQCDPNFHVMEQLDGLSLLHTNRQGDKKSIKKNKVVYQVSVFVFLLGICETICDSWTALGGFESIKPTQSIKDNVEAQLN